jgi:D-alanine transaminase
MSGADILAYLNGEYLPLEKAQVSVLDRGFLFGDAVYEVIPFYNGHGVGLEEHLIRLEQSLAAIDIISPLSYNDWLQIINRLLASHPPGDYKIYLQITRGTAPTREFTYPDAELVKPTVFAFATPFVRGNSVQGIKAITFEDIRWRDVYIKSVNLLPGCLATESAKKQGAQEAILYRDNKVTEGASSNIFMVKDDCVFTMPANGHILNGVTRQLILPLLRKLEIPHQERQFSLAELRNADEIWVTSSTREIAPVIILDGAPVANGKPGPIYQRVYQHYIPFFEDAPAITALVKNSVEPAETLLKFPCDFPIKIMGRIGSELIDEVCKILASHAPDFDPTLLKSRLSKDSNYQALTATVKAHSKEQLDAIYHALTANKLVLMAL